MEMRIHGHNLRVTKALEDYVSKKLSRLDRYLPNILDIRVDLSHQNNRRTDLAIAQITIRHQRGAILRAEEKISGDNIHAAIDSAVDKMHRQIERFKGKNSRKGAERYFATIEELDLAEELPVEELIPEAEVPVVEAEQEEIVRRKQIEVAAMSEVEAIEQMELLGHGFFVFFNSATSGVNVLYRRDSGGYGVLVPQQPAS